MLQPDEVGEQIKKILIKETFDDLRGVINNIAKEIKVPSSDNPVKADVLRGLTLLDEFYKTKFEYYKYQTDRRDYTNFLESIPEVDRQDMDHQMNNIDNLSEVYRRIVNLTFFGYTLENADKDSKLREKLNEFTFVVVFLTFLLAEIALIEKEFDLNRISSIPSIVLISLFIVYIFYYIIKAFRDSLDV